MIATKQKTIRIGIDGGDYLPDSLYQNGIQRLVGSFIKTIQTTLTPQLNWYYYYFAQKKYDRRTGKIRFKKLNTWLFSSFFLPFNMLFDRSRLYLGFSGILPPFLRFFGKKSIVFIHDFGFYLKPSLYRDSAKMKWQSEYAIYGADKIVVFSDYIKRQLFDYFPKVPHGKVIRIYPGVDHLPKVKKVKTAGPFFLYVGVIKPGKNIEKIMFLFDDVISKLNDSSIKLLLIGTKEETYYQQIIQSKIYLKNKARIRFLEHIGDEELVSYYQNCLALLNYSFEEGFCYPVLEGLHKGAAVIVNNLPVYNEFSTYFNNLFISKKESDFVKHMTDVLKQKKPPLKKISHPFYWNRFTDEVLKIIYQTI